MIDGFIVLWRSVFETTWWREAQPLVRNLWFHLMTRANFAEGTPRRGESLRPGMLVTSYRALGQALAWRKNRRRIVPTAMQIRWAMRYLRRAGEVSWTAAETVAGGNRGTVTGAGIVVTLDRWAFHQRGRRTVAGVGMGTTIGTVATQEQGNYRKQGKPDCPVLHFPRRDGSLRSFSPEERLDALAHLKREIPLQEAELTNLQCNGDDLARRHKLVEDLRRSRELVLELEGLEPRAIQG